MQSLLHRYISVPSPLLTLPNLLKSLGLLSLVSITSSTLSWFYRYLRPSSIQRYLPSGEAKQKGGRSWALVTGSSDGIGRAFAFDLAKRGFEVILHGRNEEKLNGVRKNILKQYPERKVEILVVDADHPDIDYQTQVKHKISTLLSSHGPHNKLKILINNIGGAPWSPQLMPLHEISPAHLDLCLNLNIRFPLHVTSVLLPMLRENSPSLIMNISSLASYEGMPYIVPYAATKAFINNFTTALSSELLALCPNKIETLCIIVGDTQSGGNIDAGPASITSEECARSALNRVGGGETLVVGNWKQGVMRLVVMAMPGWLRQRVVVGEMERRRELEGRRLKKM